MSHRFYSRFRSAERRRKRVLQLVVDASDVRGHSLTDHGGEGVLELGSNEVCTEVHVCARVKL
jgi:hypothetical protein